MREVSTAEFVKAKVAVIDVSDVEEYNRGHVSDGVPAAVIVPIETPTLGDRSYLVHDGRVALVIDPQRDIDRVLDLARTTGVAITHIFETHIHNDYVTGGLALARETGAAYHVNADDPVLRANRLGLLAQLRAAMNRVADLSRLAS